jgi:hypothetical protein
MCNLNALLHVEARHDCDAGGTLLGRRCDARTGFVDAGRARLAVFSVLLAFEIAVETGLRHPGDLLIVRLIDELPTGPNAPPEVICQHRQRFLD